MHGIEHARMRTAMCAMCALYTMLALNTMYIYIHIQRDREIIYNVLYALNTRPATTYTKSTMYSVYTLHLFCTALHYRNCTQRIHGIQCLPGCILHNVCNESVCMRYTPHCTQCLQCSNLHIVPMLQNAHIIYMVSNGVHALGIHMHLYAL